jgi:hypothetical protein
MRIRVLPTAGDRYLVIVDRMEGIELVDDAGLIKMPDRPGSRVDCVVVSEENVEVPQLDESGPDVGEAPRSRPS